jgi:hypothetical protein
MARNELAEKLEIIGGMFEIDGMSDLLGKFDAKMSTVKFNAIVIQIEGLLLKDNQEIADKIVAMSKGITAEEVGAMEDSEYAGALRTAIITDVMGFFAQSPRSAGKK